MFSYRHMMCSFDRQLQGVCTAGASVPGSCDLVRLAVLVDAALSREARISQGGLSQPEGSVACMGQVSKQLVHTGWSASWKLPVAYRLL